MSQEKETPKEWAERIAKVFGKKQPPGIELRGSEAGIRLNFDEVRLVDNYRRCKIEYERLGLQDDPKAREHLESQERLLYRFALGFNIDIEPHLNSPVSKYDFIPWPEYAESYYTLGLADKIFVTERHDLPYLLDFQYVNHVLGQKFDEVRFLQLLKFEVRHYLAQRGQVAERNLDYLNEWLYRHVSNLDEDGRKMFFWYAEAFEWKHDEAETEQREAEASAANGFAAVDKTEKPENDGAGSGIELQPHDLSNTNDEPETFQTLCSDEELMSYFNLLRQKNPKNNRPFLNDEAVDWLVGYFFGDRQRYSLESRPKFEVNMSKKEIMFFVYQYSTVVSPGGKSDDSSPLRHTIRILTIGFKEKFTKSEDGYYKTISNQVKGVNIEVIGLFKGKLAQRAKRHSSYSSD